MEINKTYQFSKKQQRYLLFKRISDIFLSIFGILFCLIFIWWWVFIINLFVSKGHPIFMPKRIGKDKKIFKMLKFRSMSIDSPIVPPYELSQEDREKMETWFGKFLRKTSIDESLQLINVLIGDMSLIGPRPGAAENEEILIKARDSYTPSPYLIRPGMSGYAQVYMKRQHDVMSKAWFDSDYIKRMSLRVDLHILFRTFIRLKGE